MSGDRVRGVKAPFSLCPNGQNKEITLLKCGPVLVIVLHISQSYHWKFCHKNFIILRACLHEKRVTLWGRGTLPCRVNDTVVLHEKFSQGGGALPHGIKSKQLKERSLNSEAHNTNKDRGSTE